MTQLIQELEPVPAETLHSLVIVLPTKRLCAWTMAALCHSRGSCLLPRLVTWEDFIRDEAGQSIEALPRALWESLLLAHVAQTEALRPGDEHEIAQLFTDIRRSALTGNPFPALADEIASWGIDAEDMVLKRIAELSALWQAWNDAPFIDAEQALSAMRNSARERVSQGRWSKLYLIGLTSVQERDQALLAAYIADPRSEVWLPEDRSEDAQTPLAKLLQLAYSSGRVSTMPESPRTLPVVSGAPLSSPLAEVLFAVEAIREALSSGVDAHHIGLAVTDENLYGPLVREAVKTLPCPVNLAITTPLTKTRVGSWLKALLAICKEPGDQQTTQSFCLHKISRQGLCPPGSKPWSYQKLARAFADHREEPVRSAWQACQACFLDENEKPLVAWWQKFADLCEQFRPAIDQLKGQIDRAAGQAFFALLQEQVSQLQTLAQKWPLLTTTNISLETFLSLVESQCSSLGVRTTGDPFIGVQVLGIEELRFLPMRKVIILGATEGLFPRSQPQDRLLDGRLKKALGLPGWDLVEAIENATFMLLAARLGDLTLTYPDQIGRRDTVRSRFLETLSGEKRAHFIAPEPNLATTWPTLPETVVPAYTAMFAKDLLDGPHSTRAIEDLIACPARFALGKWRVKDSGLLQLNDVKDEGEWLHAVLEVFFTGRYLEKAVVSDLVLPCEERQFLAYCEQRLADITDLLLPTAAHGSSLHLQLQSASWPAFARHLWRLWGEQIPAASDDRFRKEFAPGEAQAIDVTVGDHQLPLRLRIDSVDPFGDGIVITDYKRRYTTPKGDVLSGLAPQLPLYAAALQAIGYDPEQMLLGYFSVLRGEWVGVASGEKIAAFAKKRGLISGRGDASLATSLEHIGNYLTLRHSQSQTLKRWTADPSACGLCSYQGICRRDDPRYAHTLTEDLKSWRAGSVQESL